MVELIKNDVLHLQVFLKDFFIWEILEQEQSIKNGKVKKEGSGWKQVYKTAGKPGDHIPVQP